MPVEAGKTSPVRPQPPRLIAWELTRRCVLACKHCRADAGAEAGDGELSTQECFRLLDSIAAFARPILILTGGEPMLREDLCDIAARARQAGMRPVLATCGALLDDESAGRVARAGVEAVSVSLDGATANSHDAFRGLRGAFEAGLRGIHSARRAGLRVQVNTTVTRDNVAELPAILELAAALGAAVFNPFFLVPTGRGAGLAHRQLSAEEYEESLHWLAGLEHPGIHTRVTCAPHYQRIIRQRGGPQGATQGGGCLGGRSFAFISHCGKVRVCGFLELDCGDVRSEGYDFRRIWETSEVFRLLRGGVSLRGRCGRCEFRLVCGGCRARAYATRGDYLAEEPFCAYQPKGQGLPETKTPHGHVRTFKVGDLDALDKRLLSVVQAEMPIVVRPFDALARMLRTDADEVLARLTRLKEAGFIRRIGAVFDAARLGWVSCLVTGRVEPARLDSVAQAVSSLPEVTHNYARRHEYNLWFTLTSRSKDRIEKAVQALSRETGVDFQLLPAVAVYKINAVFSLDGRPPAAAVRLAGSTGPVELTGDQKRLVGILRGDLGISPQPLAAVAARVGWPVHRVIEQVQQWLAGGVIRRFGAVAAHRKLGFRANGMAVFRVEDARIDSFGRRLAELPQISHCYRRRPFPGWKYNLFAMFHGRSEEEVRNLIDNIANQTGVADYDVLFSTVEYKKTSPVFFKGTTETEGPRRDSAGRAVN